jgi:hypothetical protein
MDAGRTERKRTYLTILSAAVFVAVLSTSLTLRVPNTSVVANVDTASVVLALDRLWDAKNLFDAKGVQLTQVSLLTSTAAPAAMYPDGATVEIEGMIRVTQLLIHAPTQLSLLKTDSGLAMRLQRPRGWISQPSSNNQRIASLIVTVGKQPVNLKVTSDVEGGPLQLKPGTRLAATIGGTQNDGATINLMEPSPWDAFIPTRQVDFVDDNQVSSVVGGTLKIPAVDRSIELRRRDRIAVEVGTTIADCVEPSRLLPHCALVSYDEGVLSVSLKYMGSRLGLGAGGVDTNVVPTIFEWTIKNAPIVTTIASLFGLFLGLALWPLANRLVTAKRS